ncbi:MAG: hypothetical protein AAFQ80_21730 [Cyanobacteria bacterium J06621_8]
MTTEEIKIRVDSETAKAFNSVSATERQKLELLLNVRLKESLSLKPRTVTMPQRQNLRELLLLGQEAAIQPIII